MPYRSSLVTEKSPVERCDYEGLQLDTRAKDNRDKDLDRSKPQGFLDDDFDDEDNYLDEKQANAGTTPRSRVTPTSPDPTLEAGVSPITPVVSKPLDASLPPVPEERRICGLKRRHFWELFGLVLVVVVAGAVIGGVVGGLQATRGRATPSIPATSNNTSSANSTSSSAPTIEPLQSSDVMVASPLNVVSFDSGGTGNAESRQSFRIYYQSAIGNIKEAISQGSASWQSATPIFTDAINNTGLATVTYLNSTQQQGSIFYVGTNGLIQEKRKIFSNSAYWEPGTLNSVNLAAVGNISLPTESNDPANDWDSYRMAAVYSEKFHSGPGIRLFYHAEQLNGTSFVQEMIWTQRNDSWSYGAKFTNPFPNSHLAATIDESTQILRLFFSCGSQTLQEAWTNISEPNGGYKDGLAFENFLWHNNADIAAVSSNGTTYVYHYTSSGQSAEAGIHEVTITGIPGSSNNQEAYNLTSTFVSGPMLAFNGNQSFYQAFAASSTVVSGLAEELYVFWADKITGNASSSTGLSGYGELLEISRTISNTTWPSTGQLQIPLGDSNSQPS